MKKLILFAAVALAACGPMATGLPPTTPARADAIAAAAQTTAAILDAVGQAPPATLTTTTIDDRAIRLAFQTFDHALTVIDVFVDSGALTRNSPAALRLRRAILVTQAALNTASAAQRAGSATTYRQALDNAAAAYADVQIVLATK